MNNPLDSITYTIILGLVLLVVLLVVIRLLVVTTPLGT
jgi:hypothetical protein